MVGACSLPWLLPERWDGSLPWGFLGFGWLAPLLSLCLLKKKVFRQVAAILAMGWWGTLALSRLATWEANLPVGRVRMEGTIASPWTREGTARRCRVHLLSPPALSGLELGLSLPVEGEPGPPPGTPVRFEGDLRRVEPAPAFLAERPLWRARSDGTPRRIHLASALQFESLGPPRPSPLLRFQGWVRRRFEALPFPDGTARDLWGALTLGIPPAKEEVTSAFVESGTIHTLVVSGLQVTLVMAAAEALWRRLLRKGASWAAVTAGLLYCAVVGFTAPVWRGFFMGLGWALGRGSGWQVPPVLGLHLALLAWLLGHPASGCDPGFLLAWWALLGLLWASEPVAGLLAPLAGRWALPAARLIAPWLTTLPLLALFHGGAPTFGILANLLVLPLVSLLTPVCLGLTLLPVPGLTEGIGSILEWTGQVLVPRFGHISPLASAWLSPWILLVLGWFLLAQAHATFKRTRALTLLLAGGSLALMLSRGVGNPAGTLSLEAVDIGQGDALLLRVPGGDATLIDSGPTPWAARRIVRVLARRGVREPVHLILSHPHGDHAGGWSSLSRLWPLATVSLPSTGIPEAWKPYRPAGGPGEETLLRGMTWRRGPADWEVRWPPKPFVLPDANTVSAVLRVTWQDRELWLMGDALSLQERDLLELGDPPPGQPHRLLKLGHHGSRNATDPAWIARLKPEIALVCVGRRNPFGHPHPDTLEALRSAKVACWQSGAAFGVRMEAVARGWQVTSGSGDRAFVPSRTLPAP
jgi:competence protein ComEC